MKTTIDIPDPLYKRAKIHAVEQGTSLKQIVLTSLEKELTKLKTPTDHPQKAYWANRELLPEYKKLVNSGALRPGPNDRDATELISDDRDGR